MSNLPDTLINSNITIVGLGLMGGSLALALRNKCASITAVETNVNIREIGLEQNIVDYATDDLMDGIKNANILILATPVRTIIKTIITLTQQSNNNNHTKKILVLDIGSTKTEITSAMKLLPEPFIGVGGHPMCGKEHSGVENADAFLFSNTIFALTPESNTDPIIIELANQIVTSIGSIPIIINPEQHDQLVAFTSHLPYLLACSLVSTISKYGKSNPAIWKMVSSGFRDTTRLASSDIEMIVDILLTNKKAIKQALTHYRNSLNDIELFLDQDLESLTQSLNNIRNIRNEYFSILDRTKS